MARSRSTHNESLPEGFVYEPDFLSFAEESELLRQFEKLEFHPFDYHGYIAKRNVVVYGWRYDYGTHKTSPVSALPDSLRSIRERASGFADVAQDTLVQATINQYPPGAPIGWHRDVPQFEVIVGVSLGASCRMRLKPYKAEGKIVSLMLEPRSIYRISGVARWRYQHSIPAVEALRYSITFRTLRVSSKEKKAA
jgi:alkylated DNA repair dioxygenase AlkB